MNNTTPTYRAQNNDLNPTSTSLEKSLKVNAMKIHINLKNYYILLHTLAFIFLSGLIIGQGSIYWTDQGGTLIMRAWKNGVNLDTVWSAPEINAPLAITKTVDKFYFSTGSEILKSNENGDTLTSVIDTALTNVTSLTFSGNRIFWMDTGVDAIGSVDEDGENFEVLLNSDSLSGVTAFDVVGNTIYFAEGDVIKKTNIDVIAIETILDSDLGNITELDVENNLLYWLDRQNSEFGKADLDGNNPEIISTDVGPATDMVVDVLEDLVYFGSPSMIYTIALSNSDPDTIVENINNLSDLVLSPNTFCKEIVIKIHPQDQEVCSGDSVLFFVEYTGSETIDFQWYKDGELIPGETNDSLYIASTTLDDEGKYTVIINNDCSEVLSNEANLNVNPNPEASITPDPALVCVEMDLQLHANPSGGSGAYDKHEWSGPWIHLLTSAEIPDPIFKATSDGMYGLTYTVTDNKGCSGSDDLVVQVNPPPVVKADTLVVCQGNWALFQAKVIEGGTPPFSFQWNDNYSDDDTLAVQGNTVGAQAFFVTVTDALGCIDVDTAILIVNGLPTVNITSNRANNEICQGEAIVLTANTIPAADDQPITNYIWSSGEAGESVIQITKSPQESTQYSVTVKDRKGCQATNFIDVTVYETPIVNLTSDNYLICEGETVNLSVSASGGEQPYIYLYWANGNGIGGGDQPTFSHNPTVTENTPIVYRVDVQENGPLQCVGSDFVTVQVNDSPVINGFGATTPVCDMGQLDIELVVIGGTEPYFFTWQRPDGVILNNQNPSFNVAMANPAMHNGNFNVTVTDINGCPAVNGINNMITIPIIVHNKLMVMPNSNSPVCIGQVINLNAGVTGGSGPGQTTYTWTHPDGRILANNALLPNLAIPNAQITDGGTYTLLVSDPVCPDVTVTIDVIVLEDLIITFPKDDEWICPGESKVLTPNINNSTIPIERKPINIAWSDGTTYPFNPGTLFPPTHTVSPTTTTEYTITAIDMFGCPSNAPTVKVNVGLQVRIVQSKNPVVCKDEKFTLQAIVVEPNDGRKWDYSWSSGTPIGDGSTIEDIISADKTYTVTVTDPNNTMCQKIMDWKVKVSDLKVSIDSKQDKYCTEDLFTLSTTVMGGLPKYKYAWNQGNCIYDDCRTIYDEYETRFDVERNYSVTVTDEMGCEAVADKTIGHLRKPEVILAIDDADAKICEDEKISAITTVTDGVPGYQYEWKIYYAGSSLYSDDYKFISLGADNQSTPSSRNYRPNKAGDWGYLVTVTDGQNPNCVIRESIHFEVKEKPEARFFVSKGKDFICEGDQITLRVEPSKGKPKYDIAWSDGLGTDSDVDFSEKEVCPPLGIANSIGIGSKYYTVTITDEEGCETEKSKSISIREMPKLTGATADEDKICEGETSLLKATATGGVPPYKFHWEKSSGEKVGLATSNDAGYPVMPDEDTDYRVWMEDVKGCRYITLNGANCFTSLRFLPAKVEVGEKIYVQISGSDKGKKICPGDAVMLEAIVTGGSGNYDYLWITGETSSKITVNPNVTQNYAVSVKDKESDCEDGKIYTVQVKDGGEAMQLSAKKNGDVNCTTKKYDGITLTVTPQTGSYTYKWTGPNGFSATSKNISNLSPGSYTVEVTDNGACGGTKSTSISLPDPGNITAVVSFSPISDTQVTLHVSGAGGSGNYSSKWTNNQRTFNKTDRFSISIKDEDTGCESKIVSGVAGSVTRLRSSDPNDMIGPEGFGDPKWVSVNDVLPYKIRFENDPNFATAPAQVVRIEHKPDEDLNLYSMRLGEFGFGNQVFTVPSGKAFYNKRLDVRDSLGIYVDVTAGIDVTTNKVFWIFESIDPKTGLAPEEAEKGLLPVNDTITRAGEGFVTFTIIPKSTAETGDSILAKADIIFDINETIPTPEIFNVIDAVAPSSHIIDNLPTSTNAADFLLNWTGQDDPEGSGIRGFKLFFSENGADYQLVGGETPDTFLVFNGIPGNSYKFYTVAIDNTGNEETVNLNGDLEIEINDVQNLSLVAINQNLFCLGDSLILQWSSSGLDKVNVLLSIDGGSSFQLFEENLPADDEVLKWNIPSSFEGCDTCIFVVQDPINTDLFSDSIQTSINLLPMVNAGVDQEICQGQTGILTASGAETYLWSPSANLSDVDISNPTYILFENSNYSVTGIDSNGCVNSDEIEITVNQTSFQNIEQMVCSPDLIGVQQDTLQNSIGCDSIIVTFSVLDTVPPELNCPDSLTITLDNTGVAIISEEMYTNWAADNCSIDSLNLSSNLFVCEDVGEQLLEFSAFDGAGQNTSCGIVLNIISSGACSLNIVNTNGSTTAEPCQCREEGLFDEEITVQSQTGETWEVVLTNLLDPVSLDTITSGTFLDEIPAGSGLYRLKAAHRSGSGYEIMVSSPSYPEVSLSLSNICYYPEISFINLAEGYCETDPAFSLSISGNNFMGQNLTLINGDTSNILYPQGLGAGTFEVTHSFDAGTATSLDPTDPGCVSTISQTVEIKPEGHPLCTTEGNFFTFSFTGPDTIYSDANCLAYLDFGDDPPTVVANFPDDQSIVAFGLDSVLTGYSHTDPLNPGDIVKVAYTVEDNFGNLDTFYFDVNVIDNTPPLAICRDTIVVLDADGLGTLTALEIGGNSTDACGIESLNLSQTSFDTSHIGDLQIELNVVDVHGNTSSCMADITVEPFTTSTEELPEYVEAVQLYPNPTLQFVTLEIELITAVDLYIELLDEKGVLVHRYVESQKVSGKYSREFNLENIDAGVYNLKIGDRNGDYFLKSILKLR